MIDFLDKETRAETFRKGDFEQTGSDPNLVKVRQILFGSQMHDFDVRLSALAEDFKQEAQQTRAAFDARLDRVEDLVISELEQIKLHLREVAEISHQSLNDRLVQLSSRMQHERGQVQQQMEERYLELAYRVHELDEKLQTLLQSDGRSASAEPRKKLARLLNEAAQRLDNKPGDTPPRHHTTSVS